VRPGDTLQQRDERTAPGPELSDPTVSVEVVDVVTPDLVDAVAALLPQLSSAAPPDQARLQAVVDHEAITLFAASTETGTVLGLLTLATFPTTTGVRAWVEDVVVDAQARGRGVATLLVNAACERAMASGVRSVDLTSRPSRTEANRLYQHLGFVARETNVYRRELRP
jgi:ribosomal protein S18 acetylase RimI-like enzyme